MKHARLGALLGLLILAGPSTSCTCTLVGCQSGVSAQMSLELTFDEIQALTLRVCRNAECLESALSGLEEPPSPNVGTGLDFPQLDEQNPGPQVELTLWNREPTFELEIFWNAYEAPLRDGDVFDITLTDATGAEVRSLSQAVDYSEDYPNGRRCDETPCMQASIASEG